MSPPTPRHTTRHQWLTAALFTASTLSACQQPPPSPPPPAPSVTPVAADTSPPQAAADPTPAPTPEPSPPPAPDPTPADPTPPEPKPTDPAPADPKPTDPAPAGLSDPGLGLGTIQGFGTVPGGVGIAQGAAYGLPPSQRDTKTPTVNFKTVSSPDDTVGGFARRIFASKRGPLLACYAAELRTNPTLSGPLDLTLTISPQGHVQAVTLTRGLSPALDACALAVARGLSFPSPGKVPARVTLRLGFAP